jgi:hypothetical protein
MDVPNQIFGLMAMAEEQHKQVAAAVAALTAERAALAKERTALAREVAAVRDAAGALGTGAAQARQAAATALPALREAAGEGVRAALAPHLTEAARIAVAALEAAGAPYLGRLEALAGSARQAGATLGGALRRFEWLWVGITSLTAGCVLAVLFLGCWGLVWWQRGEVERVTAEVATLQDQANDLAKRGGKAVLSTCGPQHRLCVRVSPKQFEDGSGIAAPYGGAKGEAWVIIDGY